MGQGRLELPTSRLSGVRSNQLSYWPGWHSRGSRIVMQQYRKRIVLLWVSLSETNLGP